MDNLYLLIDLLHRGLNGNRLTAIGSGYFAGLPALRSMCVDRDSIHDV